MLLLEVPDDTHDEIIEIIKKSDIIPLKKPSEYYVVDKIPVLGSGKIDLKTSKELAKSLMQKL